MLRKLIICFAIAVIFVACILTCSCDGTPNNEDLEVVDWQDYLYSVAVAIDTQFLNVNSNDSVTCDFQIDVTDDASGDKYECMLKFNLDSAQNACRQGIIRVVKVVGEDRKVWFEIYAENDVLYWKHYEEKNDDYVCTRFDNAPLLDAILKASGFFQDSIDYSTAGLLFISLGKVFFNDATVNADRSVYTFNFDLKKGLDSAFSRDTFAKLPEVLQKMFFSVAKVENYEDMLNSTPTLKGKVDFYIQSGKLTSIRAKDMEYSDGEIDSKVQFDMSKMIIANGVNEEIGDFCPDDGDYGEGRLCDVTSVGIVKLQNTVNGRVEMQYDYEFRAKMDLLELFVEDGDLTKLDEDNFFHMRISHRCDDACGAFCKDKYEKAKGAILDVAFSPKDFGNYDIYVSVGLRAFIGSRVISQFTETYVSFIESQIPEYILTVISAETLKRQSTQLTKQEDPESATSNAFWEDFLVSLIYNEGGLSVQIKDVLKLLGTDGEQLDLALKVFQCDEYQVDTFTIEQTYYRWNVSAYDVERSAIHLYGNDVAGTKQYTKGILSRPPALSYQYESNHIEVGEDKLQVVRICAENYADNVLYDINTPISADELGSLIGSYINAKAIDIYGDEYDTSLTVVGHSRLDINNKDWQKVQLYCLPAGRGYFESIIWENIGKYDWSKWLCKTVNTYIKLDEVESIDYLGNEKSEYMQGEKLSAEDAPETIAAKIIYSGGKSKTVEVYAANADELLLVDNSGNRYISSGADIMIQFYLLGRYYGEMIKIKPAKSIRLDTTTENLELEYSEYGFSWQLRIGRLEFALADGSAAEVILTLDYTKINGYKIGEVNDIFYINPTSSGGNVVIKKAGRYNLTFAYGDLEKTVPLYILPESEKRDESKYTIVDTTASASHYFQGYGYYFSAEISNSYHGEWGVSAALSVQVFKGYITSSGTLSYKEPDNAQEYYGISEIRVDSQYVDNGVTLDLPPTIYGAMSVRTKISFLKSGYYKVRFRLGSNWCEREIYVEKSEEV